MIGRGSSFAWGDDPGLHSEDMDCPCVPCVDWEIEGADRQVVWIIRHSRMPGGETEAA